MSYPQPRHAAPDSAATQHATRTVRFWLAPIVISLAVLAALAALYLGGILNPTTNLRNFPIAVVNEDAGQTGAQITDGLVSGIDKNKFDIRVLSADGARRQLDTAQVYGQVVIPPDFTQRLQAFGQGAVQPGQAARPVIMLSTNPRAGTLGASITSQVMTQALAAVNNQVGQRLAAQVAGQTGGTPLPGGVTLALANPIDVQTNAHAPLPNGTGNGLSAFYYSLLLLLAGFTGSVVVSTIVDSMLGYTPAEVGPVYRFADQVYMSRLRTLLVKWALVLALALVTSVVYIAIAHGLGMPMVKPWLLWAYGVFAILAVGISSTSVIATLGTLGLLVNLLVFVILGLPSAGATVPLQATPTVFRWLAWFEPMHQVFLGTRALLYFDGRADAGLSRALIMTAIGLAVGLVLGPVFTRVYDRKGFHRIAGPVAPASTNSKD
jgi:YhgE/Pip-like protein